MAYGKLGVGKDGGRGIQADSPGPDGGAHMPDAWAGSLSTLGAPQGQRLGEQAQIHAGWQNTSTVRQTLPGTGETVPREQYNFTSGGEPGLLGQDTDDYHGGNIKDGQYPSLPGPEFPGASGTTNMGQQGDPVDWASVGPYEYPEFPQASGTTALTSPATIKPR